MCKKAVDNYYNEITAQYKEMLDDIKDIEKDVMEGLVAPELLDQLKQNIAPIKQNWERWSYMMFLLNQPTRSSKIPAYRNRNKKFLNSLNQNNSIEATMEENNNSLKKLKEI